MNTTAPVSFVSCGANIKVADILARQGLTVPTPIQVEAIPAALLGRDIIGIAQTGTGKTLAFGIPLIDFIERTRRRALVLAPTRELALQIQESIRAVSKYLPNGFQTVTLIGGVPPDRQIRELRAHPSLIVATPGRLLDLLKRRVLTLNEVGFLVLDEADRLFDMGFMPQVRQILAQMPAARQTLLFSATMSREVTELAANCQQNPVRVEVTPSGSSVEAITHELCFVQKEQKAAVLSALLGEGYESVLVFARTKRGAANLSRSLAALGHAVAEIHSNKSLGQRSRALAGFKSGQYRVLVATDIASRGIDVPDIALVVNYDLPDAAEDYVHRIGRTGRAGKAGRAISLATVDQLKEVAQIERLMRQPLPLAARSLARPQISYAPRSRFHSRRSGRHQQVRRTTYRR